MPSVFVFVVQSVLQPHPVFQGFLSGVLSVNRELLVTLRIRRANSGMTYGTILVTLKLWIIISEMHFTCNLPSLIKVVLTAAIKDLPVLQAARSLNSKMFA